jgi:hypothetical protein
LTAIGGASIRLFLPNGLPTDLWVVDKSNWTGVAVVWPRAVHGEARQRPELQKPGIYLLSGPSDVPSRQRVYVGEADLLRNRLDRHHATLDFWTRCVAFTSKDASLNKAHVRYLESRLVELAHLADRELIENATVPQRPSLSEADTAEMEMFLAEMLVIYPILGVRAFERVDAGASIGHLRLTGPDASATGDETSEGFLVQAGSTARRIATPSTPTTAVDLRAQLLQAGILVAEGESLRFASDYVFNSPSLAASVILSRSANGREEWEDADGKTLRQIQSESVAVG